MALPIVVLLLGAMFALQLVFCFRQDGRRWVKCLPVTVTALTAAVCWLMYFINYHSPVYGAAFAFYIYGIILLMGLAGELLAWMLYAIVKYIQKRRK